MSNEKAFNELREQITTIDDALTEEFAQEFLTRVKRRTPKVSGTLRNGWDADISKDKLSIYNTVDYAGYVEDGTENMSGAHMLKTTVSETDRILDIAQKRSEAKGKK